MARVDLAGKLSDARDRVDAEAPPEERWLARYARLTRKDARIRADQDAALTALAKTLMRRRTAKSERITENTLIRVAIDLLLAHADQLRGSVEDELRDSVIPPQPLLQTSALPDSGCAGLPHPQSPDLPRHRTPAGPRSDTPVVRNSAITEVATGDTVAAARTDAKRRELVAGKEVTR